MTRCTCCSRIAWTSLDRAEPGRGRHSGPSTSRPDRRSTWRASFVCTSPSVPTAQIWLERFSPLYVDREAFPASHVRAEQSYRHVYPDGFDHDRVAYCFDFAFENTIPREPTLPLQDGVVRWRERWQRGERPQLRYRATTGLVEIEDARQPGDPVVYHLEGPLAQLYVACSDRPHRAEALAKDLLLDDPAPSEDEVSGALDLFCEKGLMMRDDGLYLSLALPATTHR